MATLTKTISSSAVVLAALVLSGCPVTDGRGPAGTIDTRGGLAPESLAVGGSGGNVSLTAGDNIYFRAGNIPDPVFSSNRFELSGSVSADSVAGSGITSNTSASGVRTIIASSNFVIPAGATLRLSNTTDTLVVIQAPTIHVLGEIDLTGTDGTGGRGRSLSLVATEDGGVIYLTGQIDLSGGSGTSGGNAGHLSLSADNGGSSQSSPGLTASADVITRGHIFCNGGDATAASGTAGNGGSVTISAWNDIFLELLDPAGILTGGGAGDLTGGNGGSISATASTVDTNGSIQSGVTVIKTNGGAGATGGAGGYVHFTLPAKTGNTGTGDIWTQMRIETGGGAGVPRTNTTTASGGNGGVVRFVTWDSGQDIRNEGDIFSAGGSATGSTIAAGGDGDSVYFRTDSSNNDLGGSIVNSGNIDTTGGDGDLTGGNGGVIFMDTDPDNDEAASNGEGEELGDLDSSGGDALNDGSVSGTGGNGGNITLQARGAFQTGGVVISSLGGSGATAGSSGAQVVR